MSGRSKGFSATMTYVGVYILIGRWLGWTGWVVAVAGLIWWNARHPFIDQTLVVLCWPLIAGVTVRPVIKFLWPLLVFGAIAEGVWPHLAFWAAFVTTLRDLRLI